MGDLSPLSNREEAVIMGGAEPAQPMINIDGVSKHYIVRGGDGGDKSKSIVALDKVNATIARGEFISLLGPSGCGQTTFFRIAAGLPHLRSEQHCLGQKCVSNGRTRGSPYS